MERDRYSNRRIERLSPLEGAPEARDEGIYVGMVPVEYVRRVLGDQRVTVSPQNPTGVHSHVEIIQLKDIK